MLGHFLATTQACLRPRHGESFPGKRLHSSGLQASSRNMYIHYYQPGRTKASRPSFVHVCMAYITHANESTSSPRSCLVAQPESRTLCSLFRVRGSSLSPSARRQVTRGEDSLNIIGHGLNICYHCFELLLSISIQQIVIPALLRGNIIESISIKCNGRWKEGVGCFCVLVDGEASAHGAHPIKPGNGYASIDQFSKLSSQTFVCVTSRCRAFEVGIRSNLDEKHWLCVLQDGVEQREIGGGQEKRGPLLTGEPLENAQQRGKGHLRRSMVARKVRHVPQTRVTR